MPSATFFIRSLKVGNHLLRNVKASVAPTNAEPLLGESFLSHYSLSIDPKRQVLLLNPPSDNSIWGLLLALPLVGGILLLIRFSRWTSPSVNAAHQDVAQGVPIYNAPSDAAGGASVPFLMTHDMKLQLRTYGRKVSDLLRLLRQGRQPNANKAETLISEERERVEDTGGVGGYMLPQPTSAKPYGDKFWRGLVTVVMSVLIVSVIGGVVILLGTAILSDRPQSAPQAGTPQPQTASPAESSPWWEAHYETNDELCSNALNAERSGWKVDPGHAVYVAEAGKRGLTVDACLQRSWEPAVAPTPAAPRYAGYYLLHGTCYYRYPNGSWSSPLAANYCGYSTTQPELSNSPDPRCRRWSPRLGRFVWVC